VLLCWFHQIVIHRWGWTLVLNPDSTTTAWNKNRTKTLHSHGPPSARGDQPGHACAAARCCRITRIMAAATTGASIMIAADTVNPRENPQVPRQPSAW
jgi:hypothetical protein